MSETNEAFATLKLCQDNEGRMTAGFEGRIDMRFVESHREELLGSMPVAKELVIDLSKVEFMDSSALGLLVVLKREADKAALPLALQAVPERVKKLLDITRLSGAFKFI